MRAVPAARVEQADDIMLPIGMSIVKVISSPDIVPETAPGIRPCMPANITEPVTVDPVCSSDHVIVPMPGWPMRPSAPIELLESEAVPAHVPVTDIGNAGPDGAIGELLPHAAANDAKRTTASLFFILPSQCHSCRLDRQCAFPCDFRLCALATDDHDRSLAARWYIGCGDAGR